MSRVSLLETSRNCYKANLHSHTVISDGKLTPEEVKKVYMNEGYSIVAYTDHRSYRNHKHLNDKDFLAIAALEVDVNEFFPSGEKFDKVKTYHINLFDTCPSLYADKKMSEDILPERRYNDVEYLNKYLEEMKELGFISCYNHPYWSLQNFDDYKYLRGLWGMEIYNHGCEMDGLYGYHPQAYDELLREGNRLFCVATDDNHNSFPLDDPLSDSFGGFTYVYAKSLYYEDVMKALLEGNFYSSMGPEIKELYIEDGKLFVKTSPVSQIYVNTQGKFAHRKAVSNGETITEAEFTLRGDEKYIRIACRDENGKSANSNAFFLDRLIIK